ncbi:MAG: UvrD-helicase domain-containing protein [Candidatus Aquirickettsiella sp.]
MKSPLHLADAKQRQQALDPKQSFIVQAPAGSGKTELLVRRYLVLLTRVSVPEAIIAITFTRKAANEMRIRIMLALELAQNNHVPMGKDAERYDLAKKVLAQDQALAWNLLSNPNRLRILTIDSFCQTLTRQMPLLAGLSEKLTPVDNPEYLYRLATQELLNQLEEPLPWQAALSHLLSHLDNDFQRVEHLFIPMLARREQWLDYLLQHQHQLREDLEQALFNINQVLVEKLNHLINKDVAEELLQLLNFSLQQRHLAPLLQHDNLNFWQAASRLLLTESNTWRKQLRKTEGFAIASEIKNKATQTEVHTLKKQCLNLIAHLSQQSGVKEILIALKLAPPLHYTDSQWQMIQSLFELLPVLVAHLKIIFQQQQKVDYTEILLAASSALGSAENPSDLALALDYQIQHLLVDEFQDTSSTQLRLIEKLTVGWQHQDGRTLFLVGDPMQSIYRFRKAEVGLFLQVQQWGIGILQLQALNLSVNFRSAQGIVDWVNQQFSQLLPATADLQQGAVCFSPATAYAPTTQNDAVCSYWQLAHDFNSAEQAEAEQIIKIIQTIKRENSQASIAILVRARSHLHSILPALRRAAIPYQAIEIDSLAEKSAVQDLLALTRALHHLGDRTAWLALLRSPYCGLGLNDLYQITQFNAEKNTRLSIWQQLQRFEEISLDAATKQRLRRIVPMLQQCLQQQGRVPLSLWVKQTWLALGGPTTLSNWDEMDHIHAYLNFLDNKIKLEGEALDFFKLGDELSHIYTQTTSATPAHAIEIMTIHKAKGLEYDHVILPGLHRRGRPELSPLLLYSEKILTAQKKDFLLAPIKASHEEHDLIYNYLFNEEKQKNVAELTRLLYVACTRTKQSLHLLGTFALDETAGIKSPAPQSLLGQLWPVMDIKPEEILAHTPAENTLALPTQGLLKRLPADWQAPILHRFEIYPEVKSPSYSYQWQLYPERALGTVIHRLLYQMSQDGLLHWDRKKITVSQTMFTHLLEQNGLLASHIPEALKKLNICLEKTLADPRGRWILSQEHQAAHSEYAITALLHGKRQNCVIDRTFIDSSAKRIRWIIDYKTTEYYGNKPEEFLNDAMQQHQQQLNNYAQALLLEAESCGSQIVRCGLYFPLTSLWCEWEYTEVSTTVTVMASECNERGHP